MLKVIFDGCEVSTRSSFIESDLSCFWIGLSPFWLRPSMFRVTPSHFLRLLTLQISPAHFSESVLLIFRVRPHFSSQTFPFFRVSPSHFFKSDLPILFSKLLFNYFEFILQFVGLIRRCLTWDVNREYIFRWKNWFRGAINKLFLCKLTYTEILEYLNVYHGH